MIFLCKECGIEISREVRPLADTSSLVFEEKKDYVPEGWFTVIDNDKDPYVLPKGHYVLNIKDVINTRHHKDRLDGCCGIAGSDKPNVLCLNGHEVGTQYSDCWSAHYIHMNPTHVKT